MDDDSYDGLKFQSYLTGIEIGKGEPIITGKYSSNRTLLELKFSIFGGGILPALFQSYLTGIEMMILLAKSLIRKRFQSYLTGIEIRKSYS